MLFKIAPPAAAAVAVAFRVLDEIGQRLGKPFRIPGADADAAVGLPDHLCRRAVDGGDDGLPGAHIALELSGDGAARRIVAVERQQAGVGQPVEVRHFGDGMPPVEPEMLLHPQLLHACFQRLQSGADAHNVDAEGLIGAHPAHSPGHGFQILGRANISQKYNVRAPVVPGGQVPGAHHVLPVLGQVGELFHGHPADLMQVLPEGRGGDADVVCAVVNFYAPGAHQPVNGRFCAGQYIPDGIRPQVQAVQVQRQAGLFLEFQRGHRHGHGGELVDIDHVEVMPQFFYSPVGRQQEAEIIPGQIDRALLSGADLAPQDAYPVVGFRKAVFVPREDLSRRVVGLTGEHGDLMAPAHQLLADLVDAELLGVIILTDNQNFQCRALICRNPTCR